MNAGHWTVSLMADPVASTLSKTGEVRSKEEGW